MHRKRCVTFALWLAAMLAPSVALADGIEGWVADRLAEEILAGVPVGATDAEPRIAVQSFAAEKTPISLTAANALNASLLSALISKSGGRHTFVARGALPALVRDVSERARPGPDDPVETLLENARADILVIGTLRREGPALRQHLWLHRAAADGVGQPLELADDQGAVRPGAGVGDVEVVAPRLHGEHAAGVVADLVTKLRLLAHEPAACLLRWVPDVVPGSVD